METPKVDRMQMEMLAKLVPNEAKLALLNMVTKDIVAAYLAYAGQVIQAAMAKPGYGSDRFKDIDDELVIKPDELIKLINDVQVALASV